MIEDPAELERRTAYLETLRAQGRPARFAGLVACLVGVLVMLQAYVYPFTALVLK